MLTPSICHLAIFGLSFRNFRSSFSFQIKNSNRSSFSTRLAKERDYYAKEIEDDRARVEKYKADQKEYEAKKAVGLLKRPIKTPNCVDLSSLPKVSVNSANFLVSPFCAFAGRGSDGEHPSKAGGRPEVQHLLRGAEDHATGKLSFLFSRSTAVLPEVHRPVIAVLIVEHTGHWVLPLRNIVCSFECGRLFVSAAFRARERLFFCRGSIVRSHFVGWFSETVY